MTPSLREVIDSISGSLRAHVDPAVGDPYARSMLLTIDNLLRHVAIRAECEAELLAEDNEDLAQVLDRMITRLAGDAATLEPLRAVIEATRADLGTPLQGFPTVQRLWPHAVRLRTRLDELLTALIAARESLGGRPAYVAARTLAREYLARMLNRNAAFIDPAFVSDRR